MDFFNDLQDYFATLTPRQTLFFWLVAGLLFLIGLLIGLLVQRSRLRRLRAQYLITDRERADYESRAKSAEGKLGALEQEVAALSREKVAVLEELEAQKKRPATTEETDLLTLREEVQLLRAENERLQATPNNGLSPGTSPDGVNTQTPSLNDYVMATEARFAAFDRQLEQLSSENNRLEAELNDLRQNVPADTSGLDADPADRSIGDTPYGQPHRPIIGTPAATDEHGEPLVIRADVTAPGARTDHDGGLEVVVDNKPSLVVPVLPPEGMEPDDLTLIQNIGPFLSRKLNEAGVFTFSQIANWNEADTERITRQIGYIPGMIKKADWSGQARKLMGTSDNPTVVPTNVTPAEGSRINPGLIKKDNLQVVEGIGPKIESILQSAGINNHADLAAATPERLREILAAAGNRYKMHNPESWPRQAELALAGDLVALKKMQEEL